MKYSKHKKNRLKELNLMYTKTLFYSLIWLLSFALPGKSFAQKLKDPILEIKFDLPNGDYFWGANLWPHIGAHKFDVEGHYVQGDFDRWGNEDGAVSIAAGSSINFGLNDYKTAERTTSFWIEIAAPENIPVGSNPTTSTSTVTSIFSWVGPNTEGRNPEDITLAGLSRMGGALAMNRYTMGSDRLKKPWNLWTYKPVEFDQEGWYHVIYVEAEHYSKLHMTKPDGTKACSYNYLPAQPMSSGSLRIAPSHGNTITIDDFRIFDYAMTDDQVSDFKNLEGSLLSGKQFFVYSASDNTSIRQLNGHPTASSKTGHSYTKTEAPDFSWLFIEQSSDEYGSVYKIYNQRTREYLHFGLGPNQPFPVLVSNDLDHADLSPDDDTDLWYVSLVNDRSSVSGSVGKFVIKPSRTFAYSLDRNFNSAYSVEPLQFDLIENTYAHESLNELKQTMENNPGDTYTLRFPNSIIAKSGNNAVEWSNSKALDTDARFDIEIGEDNKIQLMLVDNSNPSTPIDYGLSSSSNGQLFWSVGTKKTDWWYLEDMGDQTYLIDSKTHGWLYKSAEEPEVHHSQKTAVRITKVYDDPIDASTEYFIQAHNNGVKHIHARIGSPWDWTDWNTQTITNDLDGYHTFKFLPNQNNTFRIQNQGETNNFLALESNLKLGNGATLFGYLCVVDQLFRASAWEFRVIGSGIADDHGYEIVTITLDYDGHRYYLGNDKAYPLSFTKNPDDQISYKSQFVLIPKESSSETQIPAPPTNRRVRREITQELPVDNQQMLTVFPNPASDQVNVSLTLLTSSEVKIQIRNVGGQVLHTESRALDAGRQNITLANLAQMGLKPGVYFMDIQANGSQQQRKLIIK